MLVETDREKYAIQRIVDFYERQPTDYADYFQAAWRYKYRAALGKPKATLASMAAEAKVSPKYLPMIWRGSRGIAGGGQNGSRPIAKLQACGGPCRRRAGECKSARHPADAVRAKWPRCAISWSGSAPTPPCSSRLRL